MLDVLIKHIHLSLTSKTVVASPADPLNFFSIFLYSSLSLSSCTKTLPVRSQLFGGSNTVKEKKIQYLLLWLSETWSTLSFYCVRDSVEWYSLFSSKDALAQTHKYGPSWLYGHCTSNHNKLSLSVRNFTSLNVAHLWLLSNKIPYMNVTSYQICICNWQYQWERGLTYAVYS